MEERQDFWSKKENDVLNYFETSRKGLSSEEAEARKKEYGPNMLKKKAYFLPLLWRQFKSPLVWLLIITSIVAMFFGELTNAIIILALIFLVSLVSFIQEYRSEKIVEDLSKKISYKTLVIRNNAKEEIDARDLVPGDIVVLNVGSKVPADLRLIDTKDLEINEAVLTGESVPALKNSAPLKVKDHKIQEISNYAFAGTIIANGEALGVVISIGEQTEFGKISKEASHERPETEFQKDIRKFVNFLIRIIVVMTVVIFAVNAVFRNNILDSLLFALAIAIGIAPEMLPVILTIGLSRGAKVMAKKEVIVKRLVSIEDFGNMDILCTDKTGTLTEGEIRLHNHFDIEDNISEETLLYGMLCNSAVSHDHKFVGNPIDVSIMRHSSEKTRELEKSYQKIDEIPFDYFRKMMSVIVKQGDRQLLLTKGATQSVLKACTKINLQGRITSISRYKSKIEKKFSDLANQGLRVIAVAYKEDNKQKHDEKDESNLIFLGFITFSDPPKKDVKKSIERLENLGIDFKILTGDNEIITRRIAVEVDIPIKKIVLGDEIDRLKDDQLKKIAEEANIFCRLTPLQKERIIRILKQSGHDVGYMGDGINDVAALHEADAGISVDSAVDVAKDASDIILLNKNLDILANGVLEGRKVFSNSMKYILMGTSSDFGNMLSMSVSSFFLPFLPMLPSQVLLNDLMYDVSQTTVSSDNVDNEYIKKPKKFNLNAIKKYMLFFGPISSVYDFITFGIMLWFFHSSDVMFRTGWFIESIATQTLVVFIIRTRKPFWKSRPGKWLLLSCLGIVALALAITLTPIGKLFGMTSLPALFFAFLAAMIVTYLALAELAKRIFFKKFDI